MGTSSGKHDPGQRGAVLDDEPLGQVVGPHRHALARLETSQQGTGAALRVAEQLSVGPATPSLAVERPLDERVSPSA